MSGFLMTRAQAAALGALTHGEGPWRLQPMAGVLDDDNELHTLLVRDEPTGRVWSISERGQTRRLVTP